MDTHSHLLDGYLTRDELAQQLGVTTRTIARWMSLPDGLPFTRIGGRLLFRTTSVRAWIEAHERRPNPRRVA